MNILIVEDYDLTQSALCRAATLFEHLAYSVGCGTKALAIAPAAMPEACLLDMNLPDMSGLDVLNRLTEMQELPDFRAIAITGDSEPSDIQRYFDAGIGRVLIKPVSLKELGEALSQGPALSDVRAEE